MAGVDVFRINMAHGDRNSHERMVATIRDISRRVDRPLGILVDLAGPKIRLGEIKDGVMTCATGDAIRLVRGERTENPNEVVCNYERLIDEISPGNLVMLADGAVALEVTAKRDEIAECRVISGGEVRSRQGINVPGAALTVDALPPEDLENAAWAASTGIDFLGLSFVRTAQEILKLKELLEKHKASTQVVAKIEKREALDSLEDIIIATDAVMVARGDLGVEIDIAKTPVVQKQIIAACRRHFKPVIVATQMLDSMQRSSRPTRAEVTDIANAILDGADACMLSGETAIGEYPVESVQMMNRVMASTEQMLRDVPPNDLPVAALSGVHPITAAVTFGAGRIADQLSASLVVVATRSGNTARVKSKQRSFIPTVGVSDSEATLRRMCLYWGIIPLARAPVSDGPALRRFIEEWGKREVSLRPGDRTVFVTGTDFVPVAHNVLVVHEIT